jgi:hypothetical protein
MMAFEQRDKLSGRLSEELNQILQEPPASIDET